MATITKCIAKYLYIQTNKRRIQTEINLKRN